MFLTGKTRFARSEKTVSIDSCAISDIGLRRKNNEDNFVLNSWIITDSEASPQHTAEYRSEGNRFWTVAGIFDGIGGNEKGELASFAAAKVFSEGWISLLGCCSKQTANLQMRSCFQAAHQRILELQNDYFGCGTTGTVLCCSEKEFQVYNLGDSRSFLFRDGKLFQLTRDHTLAQLKRTQGIPVCTPREEHILTAYIGCDRILPEESQWIPFQNGDRILLCSDGLSDTLANNEICRIIAAAQSPREAAQTLMAEALSSDGQDNITCLVLEYQE